jgi:hypothetical protein
MNQYPILIKKIEKRFYCNILYKKIIQIKKMTTLCIKKDSLIKCGNECENFIRLCADFKGKKIVCPVCRNCEIFDKNVDTVLKPQVYTKCTSCTGFFTVQKNYNGKHATCQVCRSNNKPSVLNVATPFKSKKSLEWKKMRVEDLKILFKIPLEAYLSNEGQWTFKCNGLLKSDALDFTKIKLVCHYKTEKNDDRNWILIGKRTDARFIIFKASSCYTGFDCDGIGEVNISSKWKHFWNYCLSTEDRLLL